MIEDILNQVTKVTKKEMRRRIENYEIPQLIPLLRHAMDMKAASDRALMVRLGCEAAGGSWDNVISAMVAMELFDLSLIVIDDFFDKQNRRIHKPTIFSKFGPIHAVIVGTILKSMSSRFLLEQCQSYDPAGGQMMKLLSILENAHERIYYGQHQDITSVTSRIADISDEMYLQMVEATTGAEISAAVQIGAMVVNGEAELITRLRDFGLHVGTIFQLRDDLIDCINNENMIGKSPFTDLRQKRKRLPLLIAYQVANKRGKRLIEQIMDKPILEDKDISTVASFIGNKNVIQKIGNIVSKLRLKAEKPWNQLPSSQAKIILGEVLELACDI